MQVIQQPARSSLVSDTVPPELLTNAIGLNSMIFNGARLIGPALAGAIIAFGFGMAALGVPEWLAFLLLAGACILIAGLLLLLSGRNAKKINGPRLALRSFERTNNAVAETIAHVRD